MQQYHELLKGILLNGDVKYEPRTQTYTIGVAAWSSKYDLREGFPLVTTKRVPPRLPFEELFWKLRGERNVKPLFDRNIHIWDQNAFDKYLTTNKLNEKFPKHTKEWNEEFEIYKKRLAEDPKFAEAAGDLGPVYGYQWRHWKKPVFVPEHAEGTEWVSNQYKIEEVDQLKDVLKAIKEKPGSRYHILNAWNPGDLPEMALGPCPFWHQFSVYGDNLDLTLVQRSCDSLLGIPFNIAQDSLLTYMVAKETGLKPRFFYHHYNDTHIYLGVAPRAKFWEDEENIKEFKIKLGEVKEKSGYINLREWYESTAPAENEHNKGEDHIPIVLEQLSKEPKKLPKLKLEENISLLEAIQMPALDYAHIEDYECHSWDSKARMAT
ncbi:MAG: thymidylate synthase [Candidatus Nanoarchaeia archaeon]|nr:thymidylate synthase [Candidatus Nanoarchaeia archaeon]